MATTTAATEGVWQYKGSWRSTIGLFILLMAALAVLMLVVAVSVGGLGVWGGVALFGGLAWLGGRPLFTRDWILRIGPRGISGAMLNGRTIPWRDVQDLGVEVVQRNTTLVITLAPHATESLEKTKRWFNGRKPERRIPLVLLKTPQIAEAVEAAQRTFAERATGQAIQAVQARAEEARFEAAFGEELLRRTPTPWALYAIVALNVGVWIANVAMGVSAFRPSSADLFRWGANSAWAVTRDHEYWRLLTATFLHGGAIHLGMNMLGLWGAGQLLARLYGNGQFLLVYFASALAGSAASLHFGAQASVSVGASGAVFGVLGAVLLAAHRHRDRLPKAMTRNIMTSEGVFLAYALFNGFTRAGIDNAAHVGGMVAGAGLAWVLAGNFEAQAKGRRLPRAAGAAAAVALAVAALVALTPSPRVDHGTVFATGDKFERVVRQLQQAHVGLAKDADRVKGGRMTQAQFLQAAEGRHLPALREAHVELITLPLGQGDPRTELREDMGRLTGSTVEALELELRMQRGEAGPGAQAEMERLQRQMQVSAQRLRERAEAAKKKP